MKNKVLMFWVAVLFLFAGTMTVLYAAGVLGRTDVEDVGHGTPSDDETPDRTGHKVDSFQLKDQMGNAFDAADMTGKIWIASVFFSECPSFCRTQNLEIQQLNDEYGDRGVEFVSITCDPENDTVMRLNNYASMFNADEKQWHFLTGDFDEIKRVGNDVFQLMLDVKSHSDRLMLIGPDGVIRGGFSSLDARQMTALRKALDELLAQDESAADSAGSDDDASGTGVPGESPDDASTDSQTP